MPKLSDLTRRENCFFTVDGHVLKTIQDVVDYISNCSEDNYRFHVNDQKNDFAKWAMDVLIRPRFSKVLSEAKSLDEARISLADFIQKVDYKNKFIPEEKAFHTVDGYTLKIVHELYYYLNNCNYGNFSYHCNPQKNDFANWVNDVLQFPSLSQSIRSQGTREGIIGILKEFLLTRVNKGVNQEYERYLNEHAIQEKAPESPSLSSSPATSSSATSPMDVNAAADIASDKGGEETITLKPLDLERKDEDEEEKKDDMSLDKNSFRQFTDEELEKFTTFSKQEKTIDENVKAEYLKSVLEELKNMLKELRRAEKDPLIAELLLRTISAKIDYYIQSKNQDDYNHIIRLMKDVQHEIEECSNNKSFNLAEEIMKDLKLQGITLKKA